MDFFHVSSGIEFMVTRQALCFRPLTITVEKVCSSFFLSDKKTYCGQWKFLIIPVVFKLLLTFEDSPQTSVVHLIRAIEYNHIFTESFPHVFGGFLQNKNKLFRRQKLQVGA